VHAAHDLACAFRGIVLFEGLQTELQILLETQRRAHAEFRVVEFETDVDDLLDGYRHDFPPALPCEPPRSMVFLTGH
jgi:hypothetical protein